MHLIGTTCRIRPSARNIKPRSRSFADPARAGHEAYFAGGCVRDLLLGHRPQGLRCRDQRNAEAGGGAVSADAGGGRALWRDSGAAGSTKTQRMTELGSRRARSPVEVATFRHDGAYSDGRRPDSVRYSKSAREDVRRRDFTINGMLLDPVAYAESGDLDAAVLDYVEGRQDLAARGDSRDRRSGEAVRGGQAADAAGGALRGAVRVCDRSGDAGGDPRRGGDGGAGELRAHSRGADADADRGPCAARLRAAG